MSRVDDPTAPLARLPRRSFIGLLGAAAVPLVAPRGALAAQAGPAFKPYWVQNFQETDLWSGPDTRAKSFGRVRPFSYLQVMQPQQGPRLYVLNPLTKGHAWVEAKMVGPSGAPPEWYLSSGSPAMGKLNLPARVIGGANLRSTPEVGTDNLLGRVGHNTGLTVFDEVKGGDGEMWYRIDEGQFVHSSLVRVPRPFPPHPGALLVADLQDPCLVTAYEDGKPVYSALALKGTIGWGTPTGFFTILRRVENETMDSATLGIPRDGPGGYLLKNVLYTQYFTGDGASIHYNYWSGNFGYNGSHGCLGMNLEDSRWFWDWATVGTPLVIHD